MIFHPTRLLSARSQRKTPSQPSGECAGSRPFARAGSAGMRESCEVQTCRRREQHLVSAAAKTRFTKYYRENGRGDCTNRLYPYVCANNNIADHRRPIVNGYTLNKMSPLGIIAVKTKLGRRQALAMWESAKRPSQTRCEMEGTTGNICPAITSLSFFLLDFFFQNFSYFF